jgi:two-component system OmpR family sensor kinase/two-component system sensor histidine kinase BaeS
MIPKGHAVFRSLRGQILLAFGFVILLAVLLIASAAFWITQGEFNTLALGEGQGLAEEIALYVESQYNLVGGWEAQPIPLLSVDLEGEFLLDGEWVEEGVFSPQEASEGINDPPHPLAPSPQGEGELAAELGLSLAEYERLREEWTIEEVAIMQGVELEQLVSAIMRVEASTIIKEVPPDEALFMTAALLFSVQDYVFQSIPTSFYEEELSQIDAQSLLAELFFDGSRIFVTDVEGMVLFDSQEELLGKPLAAELLPLAVDVHDWQTGMVVGYVVVASGEGYYDEQQDQFLEQVTESLVYGGILAAIVALVMGTLFAQRISAPVRALTQAATRLAEDGSTEELPIHSANELGQMSQAFNQMTEALNRQRMLRQRLIADISHELGTPLSVIRLETKALQDGMQSIEEAGEQIQREVLLLQQLVQDLTLIAETDQGNLSLSPEPVALDNFLSLTLSRWQAKAERNGLHLQLSPLPSLPNLPLDPLRFRQILGNLIKNAIQHTPSGGKITLSAKQSTLPNLTGGWIVIAVQDSGEGIPPAELPYIFERFYRVDRARQRSQGGRGLGLSIVKQLVTLHGGQLWAESTVGKGSTFYVALPDEA